jgi:hypothetical protein
MESLDRMSHGMIMFGSSPYRGAIGGVNVSWRKEH